VVAAKQTDQLLLGWMVAEDTAVFLYVMMSLNRSEGMYVEEQVEKEDELHDWS